MLTLYASGAHTKHWPATAATASASTRSSASSRARDTRTRSRGHPPRRPRSLLPRPIGARTPSVNAASGRASSGAAPSSTQSSKRSTGPRGAGHADPDRRHHRRRQDTIARGTPGAVDGARIGHATCTLLERSLPYVPLAAALREALADIDLEAERLTALQQILPELALVSPRSSVDEIEVLEAVVALLGAARPARLLLDDRSSRRPSNAGCARLPSTARSIPRSDRDHARPTGTHRAGRRTAWMPISASSSSRSAATTSRPPGSPSCTSNRRRPAAGRGGAATRSGRRSVEDADRRAARAVPRRGPLGATASSSPPAVLEQPFDPQPLAELLGATRPSSSRSSSALCERRILRVDGLRFRFRNDLVRQVLLESISPARQRAPAQRLDEHATDHCRPSTARDRTHRQAEQ